MADASDEQATRQLTQEEFLGLVQSHNTVFLQTEEKDALRLDMNTGETIGTVIGTVIGGLAAALLIRGLHNKFVVNKNVSGSWKTGWLRARRPSYSGMAALLAEGTAPDIAVVPLAKADFDPSLKGEMELSTVTGSKQASEYLDYFPDQQALFLAPASERAANTNPRVKAVGEFPLEDGTKYTLYVISKGQ